MCSCYNYITLIYGCKGEIEYMFEKKNGQTYYTNRHSCFLLQYHMVLVTKYRHPVLTGGVKEIVYSTIRDIFMEKGLVSLVNIVKTKTGLRQLNNT